MSDQRKAMTVNDAILYLQKFKDIGDGLMPVFVLLGQDRFAVPTVFFWAQLAEKHGVDLKKVSGAWLCAENMAGWPNRKTPD